MRMSLQDSIFLSFIPGLRFAPTWAMILRPFGTRFLFILLNIFKSVIYHNYLNAYVLPQLMFLFTT